ncbi:beta-glucosidase 40-like [Rutidosis leptorrhynchoides]|uniref:beta-glucosidase 40-like n=1 Tax=Rutidosis leptorrhynchoides TaxID=125765 RepID=UPI003A99DE24
MIFKGGILLTILMIALGTQIGVSQISRSNFPDGFVFGTASAAFQYEGAVKEDGRGPTIWDTYSHTHGKILDNSTADVAVDHYHRYREDIQLMKDLGMDAYRFSISWSRIFPNGSGELNEAGVDHYNNVINELLAYGIEPYITLYHWDLPKALNDKYKGWLSPQIIDDFANYAETCFNKFGDRVKNWITFNEPHTLIILGYDLGMEAPSRCSIGNHTLCKFGDSATEPYIVGHNILLSHAIAANIYRQKYKPKQNGSIAITLDVMWFESNTSSIVDIEATQRAQDFQLGWFLDPLMTGDYPRSMRSRVGSRLPTFSESQSALLKGSLDFLGINHYTTYYASNDTYGMFRGFNDTFEDAGAVTLPVMGGKVIGDRANSMWLYIVPRGMRSLMNYIKQKYGNFQVVITENGMDDPNDPSIPIKDALKDDKRIKYHNDYLTNLLAAIKEDGCNVKGYFAWSLLDNWEWTSGYTSRFGLYFVDYNDKLKRYPKDSVQWFKNFLST